MRIILTNDDGYTSRGLHLLRNELVKYGEVIVVAPKTHQSAKSTSMTLAEIEVEKLDENLYTVNGTPADCVQFALGYFNDIDLIVSGCNNGYNLGMDTVYSGTIGACVQASLGGVPSIAFSCRSDMFFDQIEKETDLVLRYVGENNLLSPDYIINVNFQHPDFCRYRGIRMTELFRTRFKYYAETTDGFHFINRRDLPKTDDISTDLGAIRNGYISITPIQNNLFNVELLRKLDKRI
jgi:5'-nucleotidase